MKMITDAFETISEFCSDCGSILPDIKERGGVTCFVCSREYLVQAFGNAKVHHTIHFNSLEACKKNEKEKKVKEKLGEKQGDGPVVDRKCPKCGNDQMSYATLQLRSADEGQTVFYICTKCEFKETENS